MRVAFRADATGRIGGGHVMRCLTLAEELKPRGAEVAFIAAAMTAPLKARIEAAGHRLLAIPAHADLDGRSRGDWHEPPLDSESQAADAQATLDALGPTSDWLVVDHYLLDSRWHRAARTGTQRLLAIDELANRRLDCDLLLDQTFGRSASDYADLVPDQAIVLAGSNHALLRPEFRRERPAALARRRERAAVRRILISLGSTDIGGITAPVLRAVLDAAPDCAIDVVIGPEAPSLAQVRELAASNTRVTLHLDTSDMAALMREADVAVGAAGSTSWERCCLGLPSVMLVLADNQRPGAAALGDAGAGIIAGGVDEVAPALRILLSDSSMTHAMAAAAFAIVDGLGAARVADAMTGHVETQSQPVRLRPAGPDDSEMLWLWRNDPVTRAFSRSRDSVPWTDHAGWIARVLADPNERLWIAERGDHPIGMVRLDPTPGEPSTCEISINLCPDARGGGGGTAVLQAACAQIAAAGAAERVIATVHEANGVSRRLFERCGFASASPAGPDGFLRYVLDNSGSRRAADRRRV